MFSKNEFKNGVITGIVVPVVVFATLYGLFTVLENSGAMSNEGFRPFFKERTTSVVAIACNAILLNIYNKKRFTESMRGVSIPTMIMVMAWVFYFKDTIFA